MGATYTYNDAIDDATRAVVTAWEASGDIERNQHWVLKLIGELNGLKRKNRRRRSPPRGAGE